MMWTGVSRDTSDVATRRLFIDAAGDPVNPSIAIATLGTPVYDFRGPALVLGPIAEALETSLRPAQ
jgi:hypothetical protein